VGKIAEKAVCIFDNIKLYFEYRINKNALPQTVFFRRFFPLGFVKSSSQIKTTSPIIISRPSSIKLLTALVELSRFAVKINLAKAALKNARGELCLGFNRCGACAVVKGYMEKAPLNIFS